MAGWQDVEEGFDRDMVNSGVGETVVYAGVAMNGIFEPKPVVIDLETGVETFGENPHLDIHMDDLGREPADGDTVVARDVTYSVIAIEKPSAKTRRVDLHKVTGKP